VSQHDQQRTSVGYLFYCEALAPQILDSGDMQARAAPPHMGPPIAYTRRLEGLLLDNDKPILEGAFYADYRRIYIDKYCSRP
jgi:hypothetical protein